MMSPSIPVIDIHSVNINIDDEDIKADELDCVVAKILDAFSTVGFVYLKNHGISKQLIDGATGESGRFFNLPEQVKQQYSRIDNKTNAGWVTTERLNPGHHVDLKEAFNVTTRGPKTWPDNEVPKLRPLSIELMTKCEKLSMRLLKILAKGLNLKNIDFSESHHLFSECNPTTLRYLFYPPVPQNVKAEWTRCGEHSDYGTLTLLFQDDAGGLQVLSCDGEWIDARPIPGTVIVNMGDLMQRWTADKLVATKHRVIIPEDDRKKQVIRRSMAYFVHPDDDVMISCLDGSNKYDPITAGDYLALKFSKSY